MSTHPNIRTLDELASWAEPGTHLAVLGFPIHHSVSPDMHNAALRALAAADPGFAAWRYHRFEVPPERLAEALPLFLSKGFRGLNLTLPHKILATGLIASIDEADRPVGAVNTLVATRGGWLGINTDGPGLADGIRADLGIDLRGRHVILVGAGGAARGAAVQCLRERVASLTLVNRSRDSLAALRDVVAPLANGVPVAAHLTAELPEATPEHALVINATSSGLKPDDPLPIDLRRLRSPVAVYDMIYNPPVTALMQQAAQLGLPSANGLSMLIHQGARALARWTSARPDTSLMLAAARSALKL